jgi:hypothetical protein
MGAWPDCGLALTWAARRVFVVAGGRRANFRIMEVIFFGRGSESLLADFDSAGIAYERWVPRPWQILNAGFWARIEKDVSWPALADVLVAWDQAGNGNARKVSITQNDSKIIDLKGMDAREVEKILPICKNIMAIERQMPDVKGEAQ